MARYRGMRSHVMWMKFADSLGQGFDLIYRMILNVEAINSSENGEISTESRGKFA